MIRMSKLVKHETKDGEEKKMLAKLKLVENDIPVWNRTKNKIKKRNYKAKTKACDYEV